MLVVKYIELGAMLVVRISWLALHNHRKYIEPGG